MDAPAARAISGIGYNFYVPGDTSFALHYDVENETEHLALCSYSGEGEAIVEIPAYVTRISGGVFQENETIEQVMLPEGLTSISGWLFHNCVNLRQVNIPESVAVIENHAFEGCSALESIELPEGLTAIDDSAFEGCESLTELILPVGKKGLL